MQHIAHFNQTATGEMEQQMSHSHEWHFTNILCTYYFFLNIDINAAQ